MALPYDREDSRAVLGLGGWGAAVAYAASQDVFARISPGAATALALLAALAAPAALALDANRRAQARRASVITLAVGQALAALALLAGMKLLPGNHALSLETAVSGSFAVLTYFVGPVGLGLATALLQRSSAAALRDRHLGSHLARARPRGKLRVPALEVLARPARDPGQVQPAVGGTRRHDIGGAEGRPG